MRYIIFDWNDKLNFQCIVICTFMFLFSSVISNKGKTLLGQITSPLSLESFKWPWLAKTIGLGESFAKYWWLWTLKAAINTNLQDLVWMILKYFSRLGTVGRINYVKFEDSIDGGDQCNSLSLSSLLPFLLLFFRFLFLLRNYRSQRYSKSNVLFQITALFKELYLSDCHKIFHSICKLSSVITKGGKLWK